jgi:hypothetical protein
VHSGAVIKWASDWGPLITLLSAAVLVLVTGWLAYVTKQMADSARIAAEQSRIAAEASVAAIEAGIDVNFDFTPAMGWSFSRFRELVNDHDPESSDLYDLLRISMKTFGNMPHGVRWTSRAGEPP